MVILTSQRHLPLCKIDKGTFCGMPTAAGRYHCGSQVGAFQSAAQLLSTSLLFFSPFFWPYQKNPKNPKQTKTTKNPNKTTTTKLAEILNPLSSYYIKAAMIRKVRFSWFLALLEVTSLVLFFWEWGYQLLKNMLLLTLFPGVVDLVTSDWVKLFMQT